MSQTASVSKTESTNKNVKRLVKMMTAIAWIVLSVGILLCLINLNDFNDTNVGLMIGIGFMIGSVHIYVIGTAIGLVQTRLNQTERQSEEKGSPSL